MARIRMINPAFFDDPDVGELSLGARLLFIGLWTQADSSGRLVDDPRRIKVRLFPYDDAVDVHVLAGELHGRGMITRYVGSDGGSYIWIRKFEKYQRPHPKEPKSNIPAYKSNNAENNFQTGKNTNDPPESGIRNLVDRNLVLTPPPSASALIAPSSLVRLPKKRAGDYEPDFLAAWKVYPNRTGKGKAGEAWRKARPVLADVLSALAWQKNQPKWIEEGGRFIPHFATWLNQRRWEDEPFHAPVSTAPARGDGHGTRLAKAGVEYLRRVDALQHHDMRETVQIGSGEVINGDK